MVMTNQYRNCLILFMFVASVFVSCKSQWDSHDLITDPSLNVNLLQQINGNTNVSLFSQYVAKSKYASLLASSKSFTVWAPNNAAMQKVDPGVLTDTARLNQFVGNHISYQLYTTGTPQPTVRVQMISGKSETFSKTTIETATILTADQYAANGVFHIINKAITPKLNIWDYVTNTGAATGTTQGPGLTTDGALEKAYLISQNYQIQDPNKATITGYDPLTGNPIYQPGTGLVNKNYYKDLTSADPSDETKQYTFFVMADAGLNNELSKFSKYYTTSATDSTARVTTYNILKDLVVPGVYSTKKEPGTIAMPDTIVSPLGVKIPINMNDTIRSYNASNGKVYVMKDVFFRPVDKIQPIVIQGESNPVFGTPGAWFKNDNSGRAQNIYYRIKNDPTGVQWKDIYIELNLANGATFSQYWAGYPLNNVNTVTYKVYVRAINDSKTVFSEMLSFCKPGPGNNNPLLGTIPYFPVTLNNYAEIYVGNYTNTAYGYNSMFVTGANNSTSGSNSLTFDYIKLVPVLP